MKNRAELAEAVCEAAEDYCSVLYDIHNDDANELEKVRIQLRTSINAWRNAPPDPPELKITPGPIILSPPDQRLRMTTPEKCCCAMLTYVTALDIQTARDKRHHPSCPLHKSEKHPHLFYFEETENCWASVPDNVNSILSTESFFADGDVIEIEFKRGDMTDEQFYNLPDA
jgi:hypothetical protein